MKREEIERRVEHVREVAEDRCDDECAHTIEDDLHRDFIKFVAERDDEIGELAREVLKSEDIKFGRWTA